MHRNIPMASVITIGGTYVQSIVSMLSIGKTYEWHPMNLRDLQYVVTVADTLSFSEAALRCHVSQPTLSGQIRKLEEELGLPLFERSNKRVMITEAGAPLIEAARRTLREAETMRELGRLAQDPLAGVFRLGAFPTLSTYVFPSLVPQIRQTLPRLRLILSEEKTALLLEKLHSGALDAALIALPVQDDTLESQLLFEDQFLLATPPSHPLATRTQIDQRALATHKLLLLEEGHCLRDQALEVCQLHQMEEEQDFRATGLETLRQMVRSGNGITLMPRIAISGKEEGIRYVPFTAPAPSRHIGLVWRKTSVRKAVMERLTALLRR
jgi:LysR family transcriptional regulator, hydrogen peroxide-inducible genes activator